MDSVVQVLRVVLVGNCLPDECGGDGYDAHDSTRRTPPRA